MTFELKQENTVFKGKGKSAYFSVTQHPQTKKVIMYYRSATPEDQGLTMPTRYMESNDGITFRRAENDVIVRDTGVCHNFFGFYDTHKQEYKGIGGTHWKKADPYWHRRDRHEGMEKDTKETHGSRGLYIYNSDNGTQWSEISKRPVVNRKYSNFYTRGRRQAREFDGHLSCFYDKQKETYILYTRANVKPGIRNIQYTTSENFKDWSPFRIAHYQPKFNKREDNYYSPNFFIHPDGKHYIGLLPYTRKEYACLRFVISKNAFKWETIKDFFVSQPWYDDGEKDKPKNPCHPVNGYVISNDQKKIYFYIHHNYFRHHPRHPVTVVRYSLRLKHLP